MATYNELADALNTAILREFEEESGVVEQPSGERLLFELCFSGISGKLSTKGLGLLEVLLAERHRLSAEINMFCPGIFTVTVRYPTQVHSSRKLHLVK